LNAVVDAIVVAVIVVDAPIVVSNVSNVLNELNELNVLNVLNGVLWVC
jgi:ABC-type sulfate transport system permease component